MSDVAGQGWPRTGTFLPSGITPLEQGEHTRARIGRNGDALHAKLLAHLQRLGEGCVHGKVRIHQIADTNLEGFPQCAEKN